MDWKKKISADHTDVAYREAVSRLRSILSPRPHSLLDTSPLKGSLGDVSGTGTGVGIGGLGKSYDLSTSPPSSRRDRFNLRSIFSNKDSPTSTLNKPLNLNNQQSPISMSNHNQLYSYLHRAAAASGHHPAGLGNCEDDLFDFINKQGEYIAQLEKETKYCRDDLTSMLDKVRDVISENEALHERQKRDLLNNMIEQLDEKTDSYEGGMNSLKSDKFGKKSIMKKNQPSHGHGPGSGAGNLILESKVAELDAQLSQAKRSLNLAQEEILDLRKNRNHANSSGMGLTSMDPNIQSLVPASVNPYAHCDLHRAEIENLNREKQDLLEMLSKFKLMMSELRDRESEAAKKVKNSLDIVETMQTEKQQSDAETRRLKEELERHQQRLRDLVSENSKRIQEEKLQIELKYRQEIDMLNSNINVEMDSLTRARLELERARRIEIELKREIQVKTQTMEDLRQENLIRMGHMQSELSQALLMKSQAEQDLINSRLLIEKVERDGKQEVAKLQAEITGLRQRMEASDMDLLQAQEIIVKLNENIGHLQRENAVLKGRDSGAADDSDVSKTIKHMEDKHSSDMADLEQLIQAQNALLDKLRGECKMLTNKLDDTSKQYRRERQLFEKEKERLLQASRGNLERRTELEKRVQFYTTSHEQMTERLRKMEDEDQTRSERDLMVELQSCVSHLRLDNKDHKDDGQDQPQQQQGQDPKATPPPDPEKVKGLLKELQVVVQDMTQWLQNHATGAATEEDESEEEDDEEEESEEEDDDEEEAEAEDTKSSAEAEGEKEKSSDEAAAAAGNPGSDGDGADTDADAEAKKEDDTPDAEGTDESKADETEKKDDEEKKDEEEKNKEAAESSAEIPADAPEGDETQAEESKAGEEGEKADISVDKDKAGKGKGKGSGKEEKSLEENEKDQDTEGEKKAEKKAHGANKSSKDSSEVISKEAATISLQEMNSRLEEWIQRIQSVIQRGVPVPAIDADAVGVVK